MVAEHGGGEGYFDNLDVGLRNPWVYRALSEAAWAIFGPTHLVVSGTFGSDFSRWAHGGYIMDPVVVLPGGVLSYEELQANYPWLSTKQTFVFLDDSYYQGRTFRAVREALGDRVLGAVVAYDGASEAHKDVYSLYRWRDRDAASAGASGPGVR
jgi:hypothetical protein